MKFLWSTALCLLILIPLMTGAYIWFLRRRRRFAVRFSSISLIREAIPGQSRFRRHIPFVLFLMALASLVLALTRPVTAFAVPAGRATVMLVMDVLTACVEMTFCPAACRPPKTQPYPLSTARMRTTRWHCGLWRICPIVQPPTIDSEALETSIQTLTTGSRHAIGSGILAALEAIDELNQKSSPGIESGTQVTPSPEGLVCTGYQLYWLTDGVATTRTRSTGGGHSFQAGCCAVYTIGFGTNSDTDGQENNYYGGWYRRGIDEESLKKIASIPVVNICSRSTGELQKYSKACPPI